MTVMYQVKLKCTSYAAYAPPHHAPILSCGLWSRGTRFYNLGNLRNINNHPGNVYGDLKIT